MYRDPRASPFDTGLPTVDVSYARIPQFPIPANTQLATVRLTPQYQIFPQSGPRIGDYITIDSSGCLVYVCYPKVEPGLGNRCNVYITRISQCDADVDDSGGVDTNDVGAFAVEFSQASQKADMNSDGMHNSLDVERFLNAYTCGCA